MTDTNDNPVDSTSSTAGQLLQAARQADSRSQADVAKKLRLSQQVIKDIENDDYRHFPALIYVRGYLRSYAKLVGLPEDQVLSAFNEMGVTERRDIIESTVRYTQSVTYSPIDDRHRPRLRRWISFGVLTLLFVLVILWWENQGTQTKLATTQTNVLATTSQTASIPAPVVKLQTIKITQAKKAVKKTSKRHSTLSPTYTLSPVSH